MRPISVWLPALALACALAAPAALGDEPAPADSTPKPPTPPAPAAPAPEGGPKDTRAAETAAPEAPPAPRAAEKAAETSPKTSVPAPTESPKNLTDPAAVLAETRERIKALEPRGDKPDTGTTKPLREVLQDRQRWLEEYQAEVKALDEAEHPGKSPEREGAALKADLDRARTLLDQAAKDPAVLLPEVFPRRGDRASAAAMGEMKEAIDAAKAELSQAATALEGAHSDEPKKALAELRAERDKTHQRVTALPARKAEREAAVAAAATAEARELEREKLINFEWEARVEQQRLRAQEAHIALETRRASLIEPRSQLLEARKELAKRALHVMQERYGKLVESQQRDLKQAAAHEEQRAAATDDPLAKYRAKRNAELLDLKAQALNDEHALSVSPALSLEVERELADRAERDFAGLRQLVEEGRASAIVALRLKNDYRRLVFERAAIARTELARATDEMTRIENTLTSVELDLVNESHDQRYYLDELLEVLPPARRPEARATAEAIESQLRGLLIRRREALEKLADRAGEIHKQVVRRLNILDNQYAYVRTHIFWMRDAEPLGRTTLTPVPTECRKLARSVLMIGCEACDRTAWSRVSAAFVLTLLAALALPWPLYQARRALSARLDPGRSSSGPRAGPP